MPISHENLMDFLKNRHVFKDLEEEEIETIAGRMKEKHLDKGDALYAQDDEPTQFFIIYKGNIRVWQEGKEKDLEIGIREAGDKLGVESMLYKRNRQVHATALEKTVLLSLDAENFEWMLQQYPETKAYLELLSESRQQARRRDFPWLHRREDIHIITRRHPARLAISLILPIIVMSLSIPAFLYQAKPDARFPTLPLILGIIALTIGILWAIWEILDWRNDFFIITSQRVVWLERVILQGASRREAPLAAIQSVDMQTSQFSRIFGYGNVLVRTFTGTGSMRLTDVNQPQQFIGEIEELLLRVRKKTQATYEEKLRQSVRKSLGLESEEVEDPTFYVEKPSEAQAQGFPLLRTRQVSPDGRTITYHKHWWVLLVKIFIPLIALIGYTSFFVYGLFNNFSLLIFSNIQPITYSFLWIVGSAGLGGVVAYHYADWNNDIYKINDEDMIIDSEKKPFGEEISRSAPIRNIISLEHNRIGILRLLLNFGNVKVVVADATLTFYNVHNPAQVQQEIYYRQEQIKLEAEEQEREEDLNQIARWLRAYHEVTEEERLKEERRLLDEDEFADDFE